MFEEWAWSHDTLARFARHHETGEVIPAELVDKMRRADKFGLGTATVQQIFYAAISLGFHRADPEKLDQLGEVQRLQKQYTPFRYVPGTRFHASFGHLVAIRRCTTRINGRWSSRRICSRRSSRRADV
jgi:thimet oligopeptidase